MKISSRHALECDFFDHPTTEYKYTKGNRIRLATTAATVNALDDSLTTYTSRKTVEVVFKRAVEPQESMKSRIQHGHMPSEARSSSDRAS